jgi:hypothetical protein
MSTLKGNKMKKILLITLLVGLSACGEKAPPPPSFQTLEDNRAQAKANAEMNLRMYFAQNPRFDEKFKIIMHGDSTQTAECPQGDGWASFSIMKVEGKEVEKYTGKCSTVSANIGCYLDADFKKKPYAQDDGQCQPTNKVPFPIPKIAK